MTGKMAAVLIGIIVILGGAAAAAGAGTHWFGLSNHHYSRQMIRICNSDFSRESAWLKMAQTALANLEPGTAQRYLAESRAAGRDLKSHGCPDGLYPLLNHG